MDVSGILINLIRIIFNISLRTRILIPQKIFYNNQFRKFILALKYLFFSACKFIPSIGN